MAPGRAYSTTLPAPPVDLGHRIAMLEGHGVNVTHTQVHLSGTLAHPRLQALCLGP
jgi:hypothetical protein